MVFESKFTNSEKEIESLPCKHSIVRNLLPLCLLIFLLNPNVIAKSQRYMHMNPSLSQIFVYKLSF